MTIQIKGLDNFQKNISAFAKQVPYATSLAINSMAEEIRAAEIANLEKKFTLRSQWYKPRKKYGINVKPSNKKNKVIQASIFTKAPWMNRHVTGEDKYPVYGKHIAVPTKYVKRTKTGKIPKAMQPRNLKGSFVNTSRKGNLTLYRGTQKVARTHKHPRGTGNKVYKKYPIQPMYILVNKAEIDKSWYFYKTAKVLFTKKMRDHFSKAMAEAMRTAR